MTSAGIWPGHCLGATGDAGRSRSLQPGKQRHPGSEPEKILSKKRIDQVTLHRARCKRRHPQFRDVPVALEEGSRQAAAPHVWPAWSPPDPLCAFGFTRVLCPPEQRLVLSGWLSTAAPAPGRARHLPGCQERSLVAEAAPDLAKCDVQSLHGRCSMTATNTISPPVPAAAGQDPLQT